MKKNIYFKPLCKVIIVEVENPLMKSSEESGDITIGDNTVKEPIGDKLPWEE